MMVMKMRMMLLGSTTSISITSSRFLLFIVISILMVGCGFVPFVKGQQQQQDDDDDDVKASLLITNVLEEDVTLYWVSPPLDDDSSDSEVEEKTNLKNVGVLPSGDGIKIDTYIGHSFIYEIGDGHHRQRDNDDNTQPPIIVITSTKQTQIIGPKHIQVDCTTTSGTFSAHIIPEWSPFGAARFLHLIKIQYFDGCALNRVVPHFLTQFGISADYDLRTQYRTESILDDEPRGIQFKPGYMAYAGSGPDSRSNEMFIVMPDTPQHQLNAFGNNPWETPFGYVEMDDVENVVANWYSYGDMSPWGNGPDPQKIYLENGYDEYLKQSFPKLSYIDKCEIVSSSDNYDGLDGILDEEEEL